MKPKAYEGVRQTPSVTDIGKMRDDYLALEPKARRLCASLQKEIIELLELNGVALGVPLEGRVKAWGSLQEKLDRKALSIAMPTELDDIVGLRLILLFQSDLNTVIGLLKQTFTILSLEDTSARLGEAQFGYQSQHLVIKLPETWAGLPSFNGLGDLKAEIQVRTLSQHIWAAASHKLQYKHENSVPPPLRRTINRISALLEIVDLELNRVLEEKQSYAHRDAATTDSTETLNVDLLAGVLSSFFPEKNLIAVEDYNEALFELTYFGVNTVEKLHALIEKHQDEIISEEHRVLSEIKSGSSDYVVNAKRVENNVFYSHVGLLRTAMIQEFGAESMGELWDTRREKEAAASTR